MGALTDIPTGIGYSLGITNAPDALLVGGLILSSAVMLSIVLAMSYASRGRGTNLLGQIVVMFSMMGILTAISWLPVMILLLGIVALIALFAGAIREMMVK